MTEQPDLEAVTQVQRADLVGGRLRDGRQPRLQRRREPRRSARASSPTSASSTSPAAAATARSPPRGAPGAARSAPTSSPLCSSAAASALAAERLEIEFVEADAQDLPFEDAELRRRDLDLRRHVRPRPGEDRRRAAARGQARRPDRDGQLVSRRRRREDVRDDRQARRRPPPGIALAARSGAPRSACASCSATASPSCGSSAASPARPFRSADHYIEFFRTYFGPIKIAYERVGPEGEAGADRRSDGVPRRGEHRPAIGRWCLRPTTWRYSPARA